MKNVMLSTVSLIALSALLFPPAATATAVCDERLPAKMTFELIRQKVETCKIKTLDDLLSLFPESYLRSYTLLHTSRSRQESSPENPRAILYGADASLVVSFNGDANQRAFEDLEVIQFRDETKSFEFRSITFPEGKSANLPAAVFSEANPAKCTGCHRAVNPRPNWDGYPLWPGAFGAEDDHFFRDSSDGFGSRGTNDHKNFQKFLSLSSSKPRYRHLSRAERTGIDTIPNGALGILLMKLNILNIARSIALNSTLQPYRYAIAGALACDIPGEPVLQIESFIPARILARAKRGYLSLVKDTAEIQAEDFSLRMTRLRDLEPLAPETPRLTDLARGTTPIERPETVAALRLIIEEILGQNLREWSMQFGSRNYVFADGVGGLDSLLEPLVGEVFKSEPDILSAYGSGDPALRTGLHFQQEKLCVLLRTKSLKALASE